MVSQNKKIAVTPFETTQTQVSVTGGLARVQQKAELTKLTIVFQGEGYFPGDTVWVKGELCKHGFANEVYEIDGKKFVMIPAEFVLLAAAGPAERD